MEEVIQVDFTVSTLDGFQNPPGLIPSFQTQIQHKVLTLWWKGCLARWRVNESVILIFCPFFFFSLANFMCYLNICMWLFSENKLMNEQEFSGWEICLTPQIKQLLSFKTLIGFLMSIISRLWTHYFQLQYDPLNHKGIHVHNLPIQLLNY